jgi:hypothetical protein
MSIQSFLQSAGRQYSDAARIHSSKLALVGQPNTTESEILVALGIASDCTRRAAALEPITFSNRRMMRDSKTPSVTEVLRFNLAWSGMNALFSRDSVLSLLGLPATGGELARFNALFVRAQLPAGALDAHLTNLHALLQSTKSTYVPGVVPGTAVSVLEVLHKKYTPVKYQGMSVGLEIARAITSGNYSRLDIPTLIYTMRNWSVHGVVIGSSFRSVPGFRTYIQNISEALAMVHCHLAAELVSVA